MTLILSSIHVSSPLPPYLKTPGEKVFLMLFYCLCSVLWFISSLKNNVYIILENGIFSTMSDNLGMR